MKVDLEGFKRPCACGKEHRLWVEQILIEQDAVKEINSFLLKKNLIQYPTIICDTNTYRVAGEALYKQMGNGDKDIIILNPRHLHADERAVESVKEQLNRDTSVLIAVGAGTIHDITRYVAKEYALPFVSVPTAASVDGFVSTVAAMTMKGFKITYPAVSPIAVFADTNIFAKAPYRLTASGISDLLGKYTALADWKIAHHVMGEYFCEEIDAIERNAVEKVVSSLDAIREGDLQAYEALMYGLILSGIAMQMVGNSRPASGAEHHMAHLWEMHVINNELDALHGEKVGVALALVCDKYKKILEIDEIKNYLTDYKGLPYGELKEVFKELYDSTIEENTPDILGEVQAERFACSFRKIQEIIKNLPSGDEIRYMLEKAGARSSLSDIQLTENVLEKSFAFSPFVRRRLTLMRLMKYLDV